MGKFIDLTGQVFGRWTVIKFVSQKGDKNKKWLCLCECGNSKEVTRDGLRSGDSKSCGCLKKELSSEKATRHGMREILEYDIWAGIKTRCYNSKRNGYKNYGGRGILMSNEWKDSFENFYNDMGPRPSKNHSIERKDNDLGYSKENCYWEIREKQNRNKRSNINITFNGKTQCLTDWNKELFPESNKSLLRMRLRIGWNIEKAFTTPAKKKK